MCGEGTAGLIGLPEERHVEKGYEGLIPGADPKKKAVSLAVDERERRGTAAPHLAQRKTG